MKSAGLLPFCGSLMDRVASATTASSVDCAIRRSQNEFHQGSSNLFLNATNTGGRFVRRSVRPSPASAAVSAAAVSLGW